MLGRRSLVIYLAFFLPMAVGRDLTARLFPDGDPGWTALAVTILAVGTLLLAERAVRGTRVGFLFSRPAWARLAPPRLGPLAAQAT